MRIVLDVTKFLSLPEDGMIKKMFTILLICFLASCSGNIIVSIKPENLEKYDKDQKKSLEYSLVTTDKRTIYFRYFEVKSDTLILSQEEYKYEDSPKRSSARLKIPFDSIQEIHTVEHPYQTRNRIVVFSIFCLPLLFLYVLLHSTGPS